MGMLFPILVIPVLAIAFVAWAVATRRLPDRTRRLTMAATILLACGSWTLIRTGGFTGEFDHDFAWRWSPTPEERLLAIEKDEPPPPPRSRITNRQRAARCHGQRAAARALACGRR